MTVQEVAAACGFVLLSGAEEPREVQGVFCCDLLSWAMGRAPAGSAWVTVMGNINAVAVAVLTDVACLVLAEGAVLDEAARQKADEQGVAILRTEQPIFEAALAIHRATC